MRRYIAVVSLAALVAAGAALSGPAPSLASPVATDEATYGAFGRAFPDPHGCVRGAPNKSPWAKGNVCAVQFVQWDEAIGGLRFLESRFPRYLQVINLKTQMGDHPAFVGEELESAGIPRADLSRAKRPLYVVKVTDRDSPVPEAERKHFAYSLSIHGIERAGLEGGIRAVEDLVTWAACEDDASAAPACATEGPFPKRILEPTDSGPTAGEVLRNGVVYFVLSNPDGWHRGEWSEGGVFFQRYNGNGMDLNRDFASVGYTEEQYTPFSEPETRGYARYLKWVSEQTADGKFSGAIDLHGMLTARSFSFTLLGAGQRDYRKNARTVDTAITTFRDSEQRLSWSPLIAPAEDCPGDLQEPAFGGNLPMCSDQWGTVWDTINYQVTGAFGDWMDSPMGLDSVGIDNEMALSHLLPNTAFDPDVEQLHIDGNKGLVYSQIASLLFEEPVQFVPGGKVAYVFDPERVSHPGAPVAPNPYENLPTQDDIEHTQLTGIQEFRFDVKGPQDGVFNRSLTIEATFGNLGGVSPNTVGELVLEYCGGSDHPGDVTEECVEVARYFNQSFLYLQAGARIDLNDPKPGPYRIRPTAESVLPTKFKVTFAHDSAYPQPEQAAYDVSRMDFFTELNQYAATGDQLTSLTVDQVLADPGVLDFYDSVVVAGDFMPGAVAYTDADHSAYADALGDFARSGGNLVLTDGAIQGLPAIGADIAASDIDSGYFYAGWADFNDGDGPTYESHPLAAGVNKEGTAEGMDTVDGQSFTNRHQTYEPVPLGYYVGPGGSGNDSCNSDRCDSPNWIVDQESWEAAGGTTAGRTLVRSTTAPNSASSTGTSIGELPLGDGVVRIAGALLPDPTEANFHPFGLSSYALTYTGYQVFENLIEHSNPNRQTDPVHAVSLACGNCPVTVPARSSGAATIEVANTGNLKDTYALSVVQSPSGFTTRLDPTELTVGRNGTAAATLTVTPGRRVRRGTYFVIVEAQSASDPAAADVEAVKVIVP